MEVKKIMDVCEPFMQATKDVFKMMLNMEITGREEKISENRESEVNVAISITGDYTGNVIYIFPRSTTLKIANIISGMEFQEVDEFSTSMLGEMANIISGNAVTYLSNEHFICDILPPQIEMGKGCCKTGTDETALFETPAGNLQMVVKLKSQKKG